MEYFKSGLKSVLGAPDPDHQPSGAETVERLVERVQTSTLLDDRRNACRTLKALSKKHRVEVGAQGMDALRFILETDKQDCEIVGDALDTLSNIMSPTLFEEEENSELQPVPLHVGEQFTEIFLKRPENVSLVLGFLEEYDFKVRWPALKLLTALLTNKQKDIQETILVSPMGVSKLMDLLGDSREVIRNDTLLLLIQLTKSNANIQKIVAFENAFDRLFDVIIEEGCADGGIVVQDCFILMLNLLKNNISNQNFFKEGSYIQKLCPMFALPPEGSDESCWGPQKVAILLCVLQVVRCLVSPSNPAQVVAACQKALHTSGIFQALSSILMASGVPVNLLTEAICALSEVVRGNHDNQQHFTRVMAPINPPREAIVILLMSMVNEKQSFILRCSVLYCFQCYLFKNEVGQAQVVQTLLSPSYDDMNMLTCGQLLCSGLYSHDPLSNWLSAVALSHTLIENPAQRESLLRVLLSPDPNYQPVTLIHQVALLLQQSNKVQSKLGFLILLATWMSHCHLAVKQFLDVPTAIPYLTAQVSSGDGEDESEELVQGLCAFVMGICIVFNDSSSSSYNKDGLLQLVANRIGLEVYNSKLSEVSRHEQYSRASKQPHPRATNPEDLLLDYEFCKLFKVLESMILKTVNPKAQPDSTSEIIGNSLLSQYASVIRDQDRRLAELGSKCETLEKEKFELNMSLEQLSSTLGMLTDENTLLKAQMQSGSVVQNNDLSEQIDCWRNECERKNSIIQHLQNQLQNVHLSGSGETVQAFSNAQTSQNGESDNPQAEIERMSREMDNLFCLLEDQEKKMTQYKQLLKKYGEHVDDEDAELEPSTSSTAAAAATDHNIV